MYLQEEENIIKIFHHHAFKAFTRALTIVVVSIPFYLVAAFFSGLVDGIGFFLINSGISLLFLAVLAYDQILFYLDRLVITNRRIVHVDWQSAFRREEHEAELLDIQDIRTEEAGLLSILPIFDFGVFELETASTKTTITFKDAPNPEGIKHFIYHLNIKPTRIGGHEHFNFSDDKTRKNYDEEAAVTRRRTG